MNAPASQIQWFLAREGQQYGPLSAAELSKFIELGHLQPNDLLWREGFPDWRPALVVFPQKPAAARPAPSAASGPMAGPSAGPLPGPSMDAPPGPSADFARGRAARRMPSEGVATMERMEQARLEDEEESAPRSVGGMLRKVAVVLILVGGVAGAVWAGYPRRVQIMEFLTSLPSVAFSSVDRKSLETPPFSGLKGNAETMDQTMQGAALWRVVKREFPEWYAQRLTEIEKLAADGKDEAAIGQHLARSLVVLRRQQVNNALSAQIPRLKTVASAFLENLSELKKSGTDVCYAFISQGESNPSIVNLLQGSKHTAHLQSQMVAIVEAIADGRKTPRVYPSPRQSDYDILAADLTKRGWSKGDLQLFSDERALARAGPEKVCQLVHDWFAAQLAISDADVQQRLLVDSLRPVVAG